MRAAIARTSCSRWSRAPLDDAGRAGKIRYIGISDAPAWVVTQANTLADWRGWTAFAALQAPYSLLRRDLERELLPMAEALGLTVAAWAPLGHGRLAAAPATTPDEPEPPVLAAVREIAGDLGVSPAQVALAWTTVRSTAVRPIAGPRTVDELDDNLAALDLSLPDDAVRRVEAATGFAVGLPGDSSPTSSPQHSARRPSVWLLLTRVGVMPRPSAEQRTARSPVGGPSRPSELGPRPGLDRLVLPLVHLVLDCPPCKDSDNRGCHHRCDFRGEAEGFQGKAEDDHDAPRVSGCGERYRPSRWRPGATWTWSQNLRRVVPGRGRPSKISSLLVAKSKQQRLVDDRLWSYSNR